MKSNPNRRPPLKCFNSMSGILNLDKGLAFIHFFVDAYYQTHHIKSQKAQIPKREH